MRSLHDAPPIYRRRSSRCPDRSQTGQPSTAGSDGASTGTVSSPPPNQHRRIPVDEPPTTPSSTTCTAQIGRAHVCTPVTNAHLVCRLLLENKTNISLEVTSRQSRLIVAE